MRRAAPLLAAALALAACHKHDAAAPPVPVAQASGGWVAHVEATPEGGMRMGRPDAPVKLVEYGSYTCPHCAAFATEGMPQIKAWVAAGKMSFEFRSFIRDPFDLAAALTARCGGTAGFFATSEQIFAGQQEWIENAQVMTPADAKKIDALPQAEQLYQMTRVTGLNGYAGQHGVTPDRLHACLTDQAAWARLVQGTQAGEQRYKLEGTPTFILDGKVEGSPDWAGLKPDLQKAVAAA